MATERYADLLKQGFMKPQREPRVGFNTYRKIDIFAKRHGSQFDVYLCSTNAAKTLKEARENYAQVTGNYAASDLNARYA
jgi:hypothetical protein